jgi:hypothetical protein
MVFGETRLGRGKLLIWGGMRFLERLLMAHRLLADRTTKDENGVPEAIHFRTPPAEEVGSELVQKARLLM